eukprot:5167649-Ditylum_brightwellii.AAC.1
MAVSVARSIHGNGPSHQKTVSFSIWIDNSTLADEVKTMITLLNGYANLVTNEWGRGSRKKSYISGQLLSESVMTAL